MHDQRQINNTIAFCTRVLLGSRLFFVSFVFVRCFLLPLLPPDQRQRTLDERKSPRTATAGRHQGPASAAQRGLPNAGAVVCTSIEGTLK
jgi:hypothetical protein